MSDRTPRSLAVSKRTPGQIFIFGRSLGGAVAVHVADLLKSDKAGDVRERLPERL